MRAWNSNQWVLACCPAKKGRHPTQAEILFNGLKAMSLLESAYPFLFLYQQVDNEIIAKILEAFAAKPTTNGQVGLI